jgi:hypothetical protein
MSDEQVRAFQALPTPQSCRVIDFESAQRYQGTMRVLYRCLRNIAMKELVTPLLACALLASPMAATAETMSCFVATPLDRDDPEFTTPTCFAVIPCGARTAGAIFRVDPPLPNNFRVLWSDTSCDRTKSECTVIMTQSTKKMEATVLNLDNSTFFGPVRATAVFDNESLCPSPR